MTWAGNINIHVPEHADEVRLGLIAQALDARDFDVTHRVSDDTKRVKLTASGSVAWW